jgi:hypothetical protein
MKISVHQVLEAGSLVWSAESGRGQFGAYYTLQGNPQQVSLPLFLSLAHIVAIGYTNFKFTRLDVKASDLEPFLEGLTLSDALGKNKIFIIDLEILKGVPCQATFTKVIFITCLPLDGLTVYLYNFSAGGTNCPVLPEQEERPDAHRHPALPGKITHQPSLLP